MSWLRTSPLRQSFSRNSNSNRGNSNRPIDATECDPKACYDSFCKHWQQAYEIIQRSESTRNQSHDDVLGVVNHLDHMVTLLLVELHHCNKVGLPGQQIPSAPCLEHLLSENLLDKLFEWGMKTGRYSNAVRLEQLKLYELLVSHSRHQLLVHEPFLRPLLKILASSQNEIYPPDVEKRLVILLNQLCVVLMQNVHLLDLFFFSTTQTTSTTSSSVNNGGHGVTNFIIFSLLIPYVHREGSLGHQARDALLLCMALSQKNSNIGTYIAKYSAMCPVLVTGLGGLYSRLPNQIEIKSIDWFRITTDDVTEMPELTLFMNSLEFCNAVSQVAHTLIRQQLLDFMYQGFFVPVLGPAILQIFKGSQFQTNIESQISAMAYLDLIIRSISEPGMLHIIVKFLLEDEKFDGQRILDVLIERLNSNDSRLCMVTLGLFDTILNLNCEDIMLELILKYLLNCQHVPISHRYKINRIDSLTNSVEYFLNITPEIMKKVTNIMSAAGGTTANVNNNNNNSNNSSNNKNLLNISKTIGANWNHYGLNTGESLLANYQAYLLDARSKIIQCKIACDQWNNNYRYQKFNTNNSNNLTINNSQINNNNNNNENELRIQKVQMIKEFFNEFENDISENCNSSNGNLTVTTTATSKQLDSLQSLADSSGYESLNITTICGSGSGIHNEHQNCDGRKFELWKISNIKEETITDLDLSEDLFAQGTVSLGPFLTSIWGKLQTFTSNCLYVNLQLTGLISHLAFYPLPLLHSILLRPDIPTTSDTPSFHQVLKILKQQIDAELPSDIEESMEIVDTARSFLIDREIRLINTRKNAIESTKNLTNGSGSNSQPQNIISTLSATTPVQLTPSSSYDPFKRNDTKRKSITSSFSNMFRRPGSAGSSSNTTSLTSSSSMSTNQAQYSNVTNNNNNNSRRESREAETQFTSLDTQSQHHSQPQNSSGSSSLDYSLANSIGSNDRQRDLAICAVLLDEWLKELSAISQEQCITMIAEQVRRTTTTSQR
uniref:FHF complex subunit HOOK-interacting protein C-terminal domain-containing protein n=1 Tax=Corethrella appendiculata TaxID=1370023 RepID=U5EYG6_9DIPT